ncbi:MAG: ribonuclease III [Synechococcus sp.]|nr:ribonuclease III [Synechococcus sp.]
MPPLEPQRDRQLQRLLKRLGLPQPGAAQDLSPIDEALTHSSASMARNHEQLEFLGDAVLRLAAAEFLQQQHQQLAVGERSALRAQLVSDRWLSELAARLELQHEIQQGAAAASDAAAQATVRAECCEALIGAVYLVWGGPDGGLHAVRRWLDPHWQRSCKELAANPHQHNWKSALQEWSQGEHGRLPSYSTTEVDPSHGSPKRFRSQVHIQQELLGEGWGPSRRLAEQAAAQAALEQLKPQ